MPDRPNILFIFTDQQSADAMSCAGNPDLHTPAMDSLAARGMLFHRAYCTQPLCTPARASLVTGRYPHELDAMANGNPVPDGFMPNEMSNLLDGAGYTCAWAGKWHLPKRDIPEGFRFTHLCDHNDHQVAPACDQFLSQQHDDPFLLVASLDNPHNICEWARNQALPWGPIEERKLDDCPALPPNFPVPPYEPEALRIEQAHGGGMYPVTNFTHEDWRRYRNAYYRLCEKVDVEVGRILDSLKQHGHDQNTLIVFSSDHGDGNAHHTWNQKQTLYDECARIPLIVVPPGGRAPEEDDTHLVSNGLDLLPTFCDYAGIAAPDGAHGDSLRPLLEDRAPDQWRDALFVETRFFGPAGIGTQGRSVRTDRYKYMVYAWRRNREQLIDMLHDPGEMSNLAVDTNHRDVLNDCRRRLHEWMAETGDGFPVPQPD